LMGCILIAEEPAMSSGHGTELVEEQGEACTAPKRLQALLRTSCAE
jgi:hypothetical protein